MVASALESAKNEMLPCTRKKSKGGIFSQNPEKIIISTKIHGITSESTRTILGSKRERIFFEACIFQDFLIPSNIFVLQYYFIFAIILILNVIFETISTIQCLHSRQLQKLGFNEK